MKRCIRRIKDRLYPGYIYAARRRRMCERIRAAQVRFSAAMREAYAKAREGLEAT